MELAQKDGTDEIRWPVKDVKRGYAWLGFTRAPSNLRTLKSDPENTRDWMFDRLVALRDLCQPHLNQINSDLMSEQSQGDEAGPPEFAL